MLTQDCSKSISIINYRYGNLPLFSHSFDSLFPSKPNSLLENLCIYIIFIYIFYFIIFKLLYKFWYVFFFIYTILTYLFFHVVFILFFYIILYFNYFFISYSYHIVFNIIRCNLIEKPDIQNFFLSIIHNRKLNWCDPKNCEHKTLRPKVIEI